MRMVGSAATRLKQRLDMIYGTRTDYQGRKFIGVHETALPLCSVARLVFQQLCWTTANKSKQPAADGAAPKIGGRPNGRISGVDMRHLLLLLPFLLFDLLEDEIQQYNTSHGASLINPCHQLISLTIAVLEWYHLYRRSVPGEKQPNSVLVEIFAYIVYFFVLLCNIC